MDTDFDVIVAGGGTTGVAAAVAAARHGARTLLVEQYGYLGGNATAGLLGNFLTFHNMRGEQIVHGIPQEIVDELKKEGGVIGDGHLPNAYGHAGSVTPYDPEALKHVLLKLAAGARVQLLLHTFTMDALVEDDRICGLRVVNKSGLRALRARMVVDTTGDGDVAAKAGAPFQKGAPDTGQTMSMTLMFRLGNVDTGAILAHVKREPQQFMLGEDPFIGKTREEIAAGLRSIYDYPLMTGYYDLVKQAQARGEFHPNRRRVVLSVSPTPGLLYVNSTSILGRDATDAEQLTDAVISARRQVYDVFHFLRKYCPGFASAYLLDTATALGVRESRRIMGDYVLTSGDVKQARTFPDAIARGAYALDVHEATGEIWHDHVRDGLAYDIPYRCLVPQRVENLLVAGRCISVDRQALGSTRVQAQCMATGEAAGTAAALAVKNTTTPRQLPVPLLREALNGSGALTEGVDR
jgi:hypothetical protein